MRKQEEERLRKIKVGDSTRFISFKEALEHNLNKIKKTSKVNSQGGYTFHSKDNFDYKSRRNSDSPHKLVPRTLIQRQSSVNSNVFNPYNINLKEKEFHPNRFLYRKCIKEDNSTFSVESGNFMNVDASKMNQSL
jgi:hypothetical protein